MRHLSFHEFPNLTTAVDYDNELHVYTIKMTTDGNQMILILTPTQLSGLCDSLLESVIDTPIVDPHLN